MKRRAQLALWLEGASVHNTDPDECCPDFSCCRPELLAPREERELFLGLFIAGHDRQVQRMLAMFLGRALNGCGKTLLVESDGDGPEAENEQ